MRDLRNSVVFLPLVAALVSFPLACSRASNESIAKDVQGKISADPEARDSKVSVEAKDGKIILSGSVKSQAAQQKIEQFAREESGAKSVDDQTKILPNATEAAEAVETHPDDPSLTELTGLPQP